WVADYCTCRYGAFPPELREAWTLMRRVIYGPRGLPAACMYFKRPRPDAGGEAEPEFRDVQRIVDLYVACADKLGKSPLFQRDLVDIMKRYMESVGGALLAEALDAYDSET